MNFLKSQKGFSLIEVVIGMILLSILVTGVLSVTSGDLRLFADRVVGNSSCRAEAQRIMGNFKNKGLIRSHYNMQLPIGNMAGPYGPQAPPTTAPGAQEIGLTFAERWISTGPLSSQNVPYDLVNPDVAGGNGVSYIRPYSLIMGTITAIEAIYSNYNALVCVPPPAFGMAASSTVAPLNQLLALPANTSGLTNVDAFLRVLPVDTSTGAFLACTAPVSMPSSPVGTAGLAQRPAAFDNGNYPAAPPAELQIGRPGSASSNTGWDVTITVQYDNREGITENCSVTERFQYPSVNPSNLALAIQDLDPAVPTTSTTVNDLNLPENQNTAVAGGTAALNIDFSANYGNQTCGSATVNQMNFRVTNAKPGSIFMCRNLSTQRGLGYIAGAGSPRSMAIPAAGLRQTFYSSELMRNATSLDRAPAGPVLNDLADGIRGDTFYAGLYYPGGTYYCDPVNDGCSNLPRLMTTASAVVGGYNIVQPSRHNADTTVSYNSADYTGTWVPCERTVIRCNDTTAFSTALTDHQPTVAQFVPGTGATSDAYHLQYSNLPDGCEVHLQIAEVDVAYNVRAVEVQEYTLEKVPGDRLCNSGPAGIGAYLPNRWYFYCTATATGASPFAAVSTNRCPVATARNPATNTSATYNTSAPCCIDFPGDASQNNYPGAPPTFGGPGVWKAQPGNTEAIDP